MNILSKITEKTKMTSEMPKLKAGRLYRKEKSIIHQSITLNTSVALIGRSDFPISTCTLFTKLIGMSTLVKSVEFQYGDSKLKLIFMFYTQFLIKIKYQKLRKIALWLSCTSYWCWNTILAFHSFCSITQSTWISLMFHYFLLHIWSRK